MLHDAVLEYPVDGPAIHGVSCEAIQFPAENSFSLAFIEALHHLAEHRAIMRGLCGLGLGEHTDHSKPVLLRQALKLGDLRLNRGNLLLLAFTRLASIEEVSDFIGVLIHITLFLHCVRSFEILFCQSESHDQFCKPSGDPP
ncbi:MAG: hypothetical protein A2942_02855 [Candidatus Lloydbacteria bacterium RIFCSPLOWO2_01_FULL_50_20]|uniref:Uncharacterized protein n=1 Tax=Candidatus Lloydbacteria bacterium RIFCSPLOWO2_01_FULL_50_20 TaxID=1798665 RepID=A0A1G2DK24_9BACT|nr:MAG: hypothetical protein A2942_02855 [Candidatus Lloydbacteria bacterium RIFCSPLOWO2_01_FULL_50_20]